MFRILLPPSLPLEHTTHTHTHIQPTYTKFDNEIEKFGETGLAGVVGQCTSTISFSPLMRLTLEGEGHFVLRVTPEQAEEDGSEEPGRTKRKVNIV